MMKKDLPVAINYLLIGASIYVLIFLIELYLNFSPYLNEILNNLSVGGSFVFNLLEVGLLIVFSWNLYQHLQNGELQNTVRAINFLKLFFLVMLFEMGMYCFVMFASFSGLF